MNPSRWHTFNPWSQLQQLQSEVNRLFQRWGDGGPRGFFGAAAFPPVNIWEENDTIHVQAELPGLTLEDLEIYVTGANQLTLKGERKPQVPEKAVQHRQERGFGTFVRTLTLPFAVDPNHVEAKLENGVLLVRLPKHESAKPRKIVVKGE